MNSKSIKLGMIVCLAASAALAHSGVKDRQVMARMTVMTDIAKDTKRLSAFANGSEPFVAAEVQTIGQSLSDHADRSLRLFEPPATDPKSEARAEIWTDWDGFVVANQQMQDAAGLIAQADNLETLQKAFKELGQSCTACHKNYRLEK